jgi:ribonuclease PH
MSLVTIQRSEGRLANQLRPFAITYDLFGYGAASVLFEQGNTKILCAITLQSGVPPFLKGKKVGWLTAEYAMLPASTHSRIVRESAHQKNGRSVEISRFIGRALRSVVDVSGIGENTIIVDCDVLQADGGTRTACITAASLALAKASERWQRSGKIKAPIMRDTLVGVAAGLRSGTALLDLDFQEDSTIDADFNFVFTSSGAIVEIQGTAEHAPVAWQDFDKVRLIAQQGAQELHKKLYGDSDQLVEAAVVLGTSDVKASSIQNI